jgi:hypothetical protein
MTQLTKCRQLLNLAVVAINMPALAQEVFSIDVTNQFPDLKIKWGFWTEWVFVTDVNMSDQC